MRGSPCHHTSVPIARGGWGTGVGGSVLGGTTGVSSCIIVLIGTTYLTRSGGWTCFKPPGGLTGPVPATLSGTPESEQGVGDGSCYWRRRLCSHNGSRDRGRTLTSEDPSLRGGDGVLGVQTSHGESTHPSRPPPGRERAGGGVDGNDNRHENFSQFNTFGESKEGQGVLENKYDFKGQKSRPDRGSLLYYISWTHT